jgi:DNA-binding Lrp family transcriptional regulator
VEALVNNGDIKSSEIAAKLKIPLSTIQRRRSNLEKNSILKKNYTLDFKKLGLRISEISVATRNGESQNVMNVFYNKHKKNIVNMALRIGNPDTNISFRVAYSDSIELFSLLEEIKEMEMVSMVEWSEYITEKNNKEISFSDLV